MTAVVLFCCGPARAADRDEAVTSIGAQSALSPGVDAGDVDLLVGERADWRLSSLGDDGDARLVVDGQFTVDPATSANTWERNRVSALAVEVRSGPWTVDLGRVPVREGGPRLVDGLQVVRQIDQVEVSLWGGAAPDLFTTRPAARFGGGPAVALLGRTWRASASGEVLFAAGGLDRVGALFQAAASAAPRVEVSTRADLQLTDASGTPGLADGAVTARWRPIDPVTLTALYDAFSTLRYLTTEAADPDRQRFQDRLVQSGLADPTLGAVDPRLYHLAGLDARYAGRGSAPVHPLVGLVGRVRWHPDPELRYTRVGPMLGLTTERFDLTLDAQWLDTDDGVREELGLTSFVELAGGELGLDGSVRLLVDSTWPGPGIYGDLFVDFIGAGPMVLVAGASVLDERSEYSDLGLAGFVRLQHAVRHDRE